MHLAVDDAGQDMQPAAVDALAGGGAAKIADPGDPPAGHPEVARGRAVVIDDGSAVQDEIEGLRHRASRGLRATTGGLTNIDEGSKRGRRFKSMTIKAAVLEDRGVLRVAGEEAASFLQGLLTNDVLNLAVGAARYAALLSPQGKILFDFLVLRVPAEAGAAFLIDCPAERVGELARRLGFYRLRARVTIADESADLAVVAFWGAPPGAAPGGFLFADPRDPRLGWRAIAPRAAAEALAAGGAAAQYEAHRIRLGVPAGGVDFPYADVFPHDANLDLLHGVDFDKGCYIGQEVVSRMRHRGASRKRIVRLALAGPAPARGAPVVAGETPVGALGSAADGLALALVRLDRVEDAKTAGVALSIGGVGVSIEA